MAPSGTPRVVIARLTNDTAKTVANAEFREKFITGVGLIPGGTTPEEFAELLRKDHVT